MNIKDVIRAIKNGFPDKAIDLSESLELLGETINDTMEKINSEVNHAYTNRNFNSVKYFVELGEEINHYEQKIEQLKELLAVESSDDFDVEGQETAETLPLLDYSAYLVDTNVEHTLYEDFTHKRPFGFRINNDHIIEVKTWQEMLIKTCEVLIAIDEDKFMSFENKSTMNGKKRKYFAKQTNDMRKPKLISGKIYIETNISGNGVRNLLHKMLKEYGYRSNEYKVFLRADYTDLHN
ncbi:hypothetical protein [Heyndrickxia ginsengihumi]|uniref:hypothetical protein n=1 Tax=Heyndrickxia ginsengihumi TaxID=363870 RepID=UPI003D25BC95|nr:hypothetical protein [Caldibacillus thermoamylovorans]